MAYRGIAFLLLPVAVIAISLTVGYVAAGFLVICALLWIVLIGFVVDSTEENDAGADR